MKSFTCKLYTQMLLFSLATFKGRSLYHCYYVGFYVQQPTIDYKFHLPAVVNRVDANCNPFNRYLSWICQAHSAAPFNITCLKRTYQIQFSHVHSSVHVVQVTENYVNCFLHGFMRVESKSLPTPHLTLHNSGDLQISISD